MSNYLWIVYWGERITVTVKLRQLMVGLWIDEFDNLLLHLGIVNATIRLRPIKRSELIAQGPPESKEQP